MGSPYKECTDSTGRNCLGVTELDITYHFIRNEIANNKLSLLYVNTIIQLANGFTKALNNNKQLKFITELNLRPV